MARRPRLITDVAVDPEDRYPRGVDLYYECLRCRCLLPSNTTHNGGCFCGNVFMDVDGFKFLVNDYKKLRVVRIAGDT